MNSRHARALKPLLRLSNRARYSLTLISRIYVILHTQVRRVWAVQAISRVMTTSFRNSLEGIEYRNAVPSVIVAHARNVRLIGDSSRKDDQLDARTLARLARIDPGLQ